MKRDSRDDHDAAGHDIHFLKRLERISLPQVEVAMSLYNDSQLVRFILERVTLPESAESVALSLGDPEKGPFVLVTRTGRFVTCLGEGMRVDPGTPVVSNQRLNSLIDKAGELRERVEQAQKVAGDKSRVYRLLKRLFTAGDELSREEFIGISAWGPLLCHEFMLQLLDAVNYLDDARLVLRKLDKPPRQYDEPLRHYWNMFWATGHLALLIGADARELADRMPPVWQQMTQSGLTLSWGIMRQGFLPLAVRGAWMAGKLGRRGLAMYKKKYEEAPSVLQLADGGLGLIALAARHSGLRGEIRKAMPREIPDDGTYITRFKRLLVTATWSTLRLYTEAPEKYNRVITDLGRGLYSQFVAGGSGGPGGPDPSAPDGPEQLAAVPDDLLLPLLAWQPLCFLKDSDVAIHMTLMVPFAARAEPEAFYLKRVDLERLQRPWQPEDSLQLLRLYRDRYQGPAKPARAAPAPGRNDPCPCGSGKKYKRCCADGNPAQGAAQDPGA
jgi:hypothetical protein